MKRFSFFFATYTLNLDMQLAELLTSIVYFSFAESLSVTLCNLFLIILRYRPIIGYEWIDYKCVNFRHAIWIVIVILALDIHWLFLIIHVFSMHFYTFCPYIIFYNRKQKLFKKNYQLFVNHKKLLIKSYKKLKDKQIKCFKRKFFKKKFYKLLQGR